MTTTLGKDILNFIKTYDGIPGGNWDILEFTEIYNKRYKSDASGQLILFAVISLKDEVFKGTEDSIFESIHNMTIKIKDSF